MPSAVRAGLAVNDAVCRLATHEPLNVRIGIATGLVVVGDLIGAGAAQERGVVGETPNLVSVGRRWPGSPATGKPAFPNEFNQPVVSDKERL
jgi:hypothetical protein